MDYVIYFIMIFLGAAIPFIEYMVAIPIGVIVGLPLIPTIIFGFLGNLVTVLLLIVLVDKIRGFLRNKKEQQPRVPAEEEVEDANQAHEETFTADTSETQWHEDYTNKRREKARKLWDKYGLPGLAVIGTGFLSSHLTALMACTFGGNRTHVSIWMTISLILWSVITGVAVQLGMDTIFR